MISPEILRRYPFFCCLNEDQQKAIAMITEEIQVEPGTVLFREGQAVQALYVLVEGDVDLYYAASGNAHDEFLVGEVNVGEAFGISALIEPYTLTATARVASWSRLLKIDAPALRALCEVDCKMGYALTRQVAQIALERLHFARVELAAARQPS
jgi:CRP-like cAMP-binding protein